MWIDLFKNMAHNLKKKTQGNNIMFETIEPIARFVSKDLITQYLSHKKIDHKNVGWELSAALLKLDICRLIERISSDKSHQVLSDFSRITRMISNEGIDTLSNSVLDIPSDLTNSYEISFWCFLHHKKLFEDAEYELNYKNPHQQFLENILNNGKIFGVLFICVSFLINLAQVFNDEHEARYVAQNILHFILGSLTVFFMNRDKK